jgi:hypothetical protein
MPHDTTLLPSLPENELMSLARHISSELERAIHRSVSGGGSNPQPGAIAGMVADIKALQELVEISNEQ